MATRRGAGKEAGRSKRGRASRSPTAPERRILERRTPVVLTIAGSDSGGGAGIQADLRVFTRLGVFGTTAITAITAQNTIGISRVNPVDPDLVRAQIEAVASDLSPRAIKSGMLANAAIIHAVATAIRANHSRLASAGPSSRPARRGPGLPPAVDASPPYVLDPVMVASSGTSLLDPDAVATLRRVLLPLADLVTPNMSEAAALVGESVTDLKAMERAARLLVDREGVRAALVTGGHLAGPYTVDVLYDGGVHYFRNTRIATHDTHGTGCTLSAAIVAHLALGKTLRIAIREGIRYVRHALRHSVHLGLGVGPVA